MYNLSHINPTEQQNEPLSWFANDLPSKPYCSHEKCYSIIRNKANALSHAYIQPNHPNRIHWLVFDIDREDALLTYYDRDLPPPQIIAQNPLNGHCHYFYRLRTPVCIGGTSSTKALNYLMAVHLALTHALGADRGYTGNLAKNPLSPSHKICTTTAESYDLADLHNHLDLTTATPRRFDISANDTGFGRNVTLFDTVRVQTYPIADQHDYNALLEVVEGMATQINNTLSPPLPHNEIMHTVRSIVRFCKGSKWGERSKASNERFSEVQRERVTKRWGDNTEKKKQAQNMANLGVKMTEIARTFGVSRATLYTWGIQRKKR